MPELPEVETIVRDINTQNIQNATITAVGVFWRNSICAASSAYIKKTLYNQSIKKIWRRGKFIVFDLEMSSQILIHLRMSGRINICPTSTKRNKHEHICITLNNKTDVRLHDTRKFARVYIGKHTLGVLEKLGIEPLSNDFNAKYFYSLLSNAKKKVKPFLLDQSNIVGLGNIYVDEALWLAKIHPERITNTISIEESSRLKSAIKTVLKKGIKNRGTSLGRGKGNFVSIDSKQGHNYETLIIYKQTASPCPICKTPIEKIIVAQRSTHICPKCQKV